MINEEQLRGKWNEVRGKIRSKWSQLSDDDVGEFHGNVDQLVGKIQQKTGAARDKIESYLNEISSGTAEGAGRMGATLQEAGQRASDMASRAGNRVSEMGSRAAASVEDATSSVREAISSGYSDAEDMVRHRPAQSVAVAFGAGIVTGLALALLLRDQDDSRSWGSSRSGNWSDWARDWTPSYSKHSYEGLGRRISDAVASVLPDSLTGR